MFFLTDFRRLQNDSRLLGNYNVHRHVVGFGRNLVEELEIVTHTDLYGGGGGT